MTTRQRPRARLSTLVGGLALCLFGLWVSLISLIVGIVPQSPNPYVMDGDPCCVIPDTWADTRWMAFWGWLWLGAGMISFVTGLLLLRRASTGEQTRWRYVPLGVAGVMAFAATAIVIAYLALDEAPDVQRCREAQAKLPSYRAASLQERTQLSERIASCGLLSDRNATEVLRLLGPPLDTSAPPGSVADTWDYGPGLLSIRLSLDQSGIRGDVVDVTINR